MDSSSSADGNGEIHKGRTAEFIESPDALFEITTYLKNFNRECSSSDQGTSTSTSSTEATTTLKPIFTADIDLDFLDDLDEVMDLSFGAGEVHSQESQSQLPSTVGTVPSQIEPKSNDGESKIVTTSSDEKEVQDSKITKKPSANSGTEDQMHLSQTQSCSRSHIDPEPLDLSSTGQNDAVEPQVPAKTPRRLQPLFVYFDPPQDEPLDYSLRSLARTDVDVGHQSRDDVSIQPTPSAPEWKSVETRPKRKAAMSAMQKIGNSKQVAAAVRTSIMQGKLRRMNSANSSDSSNSDSGESGNDEKTDQDYKPSRKQAVNFESTIRRRERKYKDSTQGGEAKGL